MIGYPAACVHQPAAGVSRPGSVLRPGLAVVPVLPNLVCVDAFYLPHGLRGLVYAQGEMVEPADFGPDAALCGLPRLRLSARGALVLPQPPAQRPVLHRHGAGLPAFDLPQQALAPDRLWHQPCDRAGSHGAGLYRRAPGLQHHPSRRGRQVEPRV